MIQAHDQLAEWKASQFSDLPYWGIILASYKARTHTHTHTPLALIYLEHIHIFPIQDIHYDQSKYYLQTTASTLTTT